MFLHSLLRNYEQPQEKPAQNAVWLLISAQLHIMTEVGFLCSRSQGLPLLSDSQMNFEIF